MINLIKSPQIGLSQDFIDTINAIFAQISVHNHLPNQYGGLIQSDSLIWTGGLLEFSLIDVSYISFYKRETAIQDNSLFVDGEFQDLYYKKLGVANPIQITNRPLVAQTKVINGIKGDFSLIQLNITFDTNTNTYTFNTSVGLCDINVFELEFNSITAKKLYCNHLYVTNAPDRTQLNGYAYFNDDKTFTYSSKDNLLDKTNKPIASTLIFDNIVNLSSEAYGIAQVTQEVGFFSVRYRYGNEEQSLLYGVEGSFFPLATDLKTGDNYKQIFFQEPLMTQSMSSFMKFKTNETMRLVFRLFKPGYKKYIEHYAFNLFTNDPTGLSAPQDVKQWNDIAINNFAEGYIQSYVIADAVASNKTVDSQYFKFFYLYHYGDPA